MFETRPNLHRSWDNYNWDWALICKRPANRACYLGLAREKFAH